MHLFINATKESKDSETIKPPAFLLFCLKCYFLIHCCRVLPFIVHVGGSSQTPLLSHEIFSLPCVSYPSIHSYKEVLPNVMPDVLFSIEKFPGVGVCPHSVRKTLNYLDGQHYVFSMLKINRIQQGLSLYDKFINVK